MIFTQKKFLSLSTKSQHKKCGDFLKRLYTLLLVEKDVAEEYRSYQSYASWLSLPPLSSLNLKSISDRLHFHYHAAEVSLKEDSLLPHIITQDAVTPRAPSLPIAVYLDHIRSAHNVGSILRSCESFHLGEIFFSEQTPFIDCRKVKKAAMGCERHLKCHQVSTLESLPRPLIALETAQAATPLHEYTFPETCTIAVGNEEYGCSDLLLSEADVILRIPLQGHKNSLNVANSFAIAAYAIRLQHTSDITTSCSC